MNLWDTFTGSAFRDLVDLLCENSNLPSSGGTFFSSTRCYAADRSVDSGLSMASVEPHAPPRGNNLDFGCNALQLFQNVL